MDTDITGKESEDEAIDEEEMKDVFDKIPEDLGKDAFDDIPEKVEDDGTSMEVDDNDNDEDAIKESKLQSKCNFREDLKVAEEILNIPSDVTVTTDVREMNDVCSDIIEDDVSKPMSYHE